MKFWSCFHPTQAALFLFLCLPSVSAYFVVDSPSSSSRWRLGEPYPISWTKSVDDGIDLVDVELARLTSDGITYVAKYVPTSPNHLNLVVQDLPTGDDYFVILINSTHGFMYATSSRFSIVDSSASDATQERPFSEAPTVTVSGIPDPTRQWATTLASISGSLSLFALGPGWTLMLLTSLLGVLAGLLTVL